MPHPLHQALLNLGERIDEDLVSALYQKSSLRTESIVDELERRSIVRDDSSQLNRPTEEQLWDSSEHVIKSARRRASVRGAMTGAVGLLAIPPETMAAMIQILHLSQRLAVVWGHDPDTDRGRMLLVRALAQAHQVDLPDQGQLRVRVRDLRRLAGKQLPDRRHTSLLIALSLARHSLGKIGSGVTRALPGIGAVAGGIEARRNLMDSGMRMAEVYARAWRGSALLEGPVEDAVELHEPGLATAPSAR